MIIIATSQRMECPTCKKVLSFGANVTSETVPVTLCCPFCPYQFSIGNKDEERYKRLAKIPYTRKSEGMWGILEKEDMPVGDEASIVEQELSDIPPAVKVASFSSQVKDLGATALSFLKQADDIRAAVQEMADQMGYEMRKELDQCDAMKEWNPQLLYHFIRNPFSKIDANCLDPMIEPYSGFLLSPKFYPKLHGFPISCRGGYYVQAVTPYSQLAFPLENHVAESLDLRVAEQLEIYGDKLIGKSLPLLWKEVPGCAEDVDHSILNPSLVIQERVTVRKWMAAHGAMPWQPLAKIKEEFFPYHEGMLKADCDIEGILNFREQFTCTGRAVVCWQSIPLARMAASVLGHGMRGIKVVFSNGKPHDWHGGFKLEYEDKRQFVYMDTDQRHKIHVLNQVSLMIVDATDVMPPLPFWNWLHEYQGALIVILRDGLLDTFEENEYAQAIYSLANLVSVIPDSNHWRNAWKSYECDPPESILRTLSAMRFMEK